MKTIIVFDSFFGNTREISVAIYKALSQTNQADIHSVNQINTEEATSADFLIVGSPTRGFRPTPSIVRLLKSIPKNALHGKHVAAFDTRIKLSDINSKALRFMVKKGGYAAKPILAQLVKRGGIQLGKPGGFYVKGEEGPLYEGETDRAIKWAKQLFMKVSAGK